MISRSDTIISEPDISADGAGSANPAYRSLWALRRAHPGPLAFLAEEARRGDVADFTIRRQRAALVSHPSAIEHILVTHGQKFSKAPALQRATRLLGGGLLTAEPPVHPERRRVMQPAFHRQRLERYAAIMAARADERIATWTDGATVDMLREMTSVTLAAVGDTLFSTDLRPYERRIRRSVVSGMAVLDPLVSLVAPNRRVRPARRRLLEVVERLVAPRLASGEIGDDLLGMLLAARNETSTLDHLYDDVLTILLAGHDTITTALTWTWMFVDAHPEVDDRLHEEATRVLGDRAATYADASNLVYARAVLAESLRLRPPAWLLARRALESQTIDGHDVPAGTLVLLCPYLVHRDPRFWDDPLAFNPDRWIDPPARERPKLAYFPFGAGRRSCMGESFAWLEGVIVLATIARRWRLRLVDAAPPTELRITMRPIGPVTMAPMSRD
jgi:cytochrome P450